MRQTRRISKPYGLRARFAVSIIVAALISFAVFWILFMIKDYMISSYFNDPSVQTKIMNKRVAEFQEYVTDNDISSADLSALKKWEKSQPLILLELYDAKDLVYSSYYHIDGVIEEYINNNNGLTDRNNIYDIEFTDKHLSAVMYMDVSYKYYILGNAIAFMMAIILFMFLFIRSNREIIRYVIILGKDVQIIEGGNLDYEVSVEGNDELTDLAKSMNRMRESFKDQLLTEQQLHNANSRLITEMSHDLRTPLTGLMLYTEILKSGKYNDEDELREYLEKIDGKARVLKHLSDNLFEYAVDSNRTTKNQTEDSQKALSDFVGEIIGDLEVEGFMVDKKLEWKSAKIKVDSELLERISGNIVSNILRYADKSSPVIIESLYSNDYCGISFLNKLGEIQENSDSHGIGLSSVKSMMEQMCGKCSAEQTDDAFDLSLLFRRI